MGDTIDADGPSQRETERLDERLRHEARTLVRIEEYQARAEEAKAAHAELATANAALRSSAAGLEISHQQLRSANEELLSANEGLQVRIGEVGQANDDLLDLMTSAEFGAIFVDRAGRVKRFTSSVRDFFDLISTDVGRPFLDITNKLGLPDLAGPLCSVLDDLQTLEREVRTAVGRWYLIRLLPYRTADRRIEGVVVTFLDITARRAAEAALRETEAELRERLEERVRERTRQLEDLSASRQQLLERLITITEEERHRIARELHDEMGQHLTALRVNLETLPASDRLADLKDIIARIDGSIDRLAFELRPPVLDQLGVRGAITALADEFSRASGIGVSTHISIGDDERFPDAVESTVYRAVQESLTNVSKHSGATAVSVILDREDAMLRAIVEDNGAGFDAVGVVPAAPSGGKFGLLGMRERLALVRGTMDIESQAGHGTTVYVRVPVEPRSTK